MSIWDDPELGGDDAEYLKLVSVGDGVSGVITAIETKVWDDGKRCPQLTILPNGADEPVVWTAGQTQAIRKLKELRPAVGDRINVRLDEIERRSGNKTLKHISVDITPAKRSETHDGNTVNVGPPTGAAAEPAPNGLDPVLWAQLSTERRASVLASMSEPAAAEAPF